MAGVGESWRLRAFNSVVFSRYRVAFVYTYITISSACENNTHKDEIQTVSLVEFEAVMVLP